MTYRELYTIMNKLFTEEQLDSTITIYDKENDEYYPATLTFTDEKTCDVLDDKHPIIVAGNNMNEIIAKLFNT